MNTKRRYIKLKQVGIFITLFFLMIFGENGQAQSQTTISPFEGSEHWAEYKADFDRFALAEAGDTKKIFTIEGRLVSNIYSKPESKSTYEVFRSYERELKTSGFKVLSNSTDKTKTYYLLSKLYGHGSTNHLSNRNYSTKVRGLVPYYQSLLSGGEYYLSAKRENQGRITYVAVVLNKPSAIGVKYSHMYMVDILEVANMETGTVQITEELLTSKIEAEGKAIIYSIYFDTDKAEILPESRTALETIAKYLKNHSNQRFYIVGHTDDTGTLTHNMDLSERRALAVVNSLKTEYGVDARQIESKGVGPLTPVASNETAEGRQLNRRVEMVLKLGN